MAAGASSSSLSTAAVENTAVKTAPAVRRTAATECATPNASTARYSGIAAPPIANDRYRRKCAEADDGERDDDLEEHLRP